MHLREYTALFFLLLSVIFVFIWIIGLINPSFILRWDNPAKRTRKRVTMYSLLAIVVTFALFVIIVPKTSALEEVYAKLDSNDDYDVIGTFIYKAILHIDAEVTSVIDGDTFRIKMEDGETDKVRLLLIDTPEIGQHPEPYGQKAREYANELLQNQKVHLEFDKSERDQYGRLLAYAYVGDKMINELLLEKGFARVAVFPPDIEFENEFKAIEKKARETKLGIWSIENYVTDRGCDENAASEASQ
ncbi:thermonuclease family protein [Paenibacillus pedocola]|uniref:thermonuclease family protein n=1 Tax=Paenibacillus pedocola TaxID=3242193 RepID=UPI00287772C4|nr:thermonuclease family protein [Paenibacillus typhae]